MSAQNNNLYAANGVAVTTAGLITTTSTAPRPEALPIKANGFPDKGLLPIG